MLLDFGMAMSFPPIMSVVKSVVPVFLFLCAVWKLRENPIKLRLFCAASSQFPFLNLLIIVSGSVLCTKLYCLAVIDLWVSKLRKAHVPCVGS